MNKKELDSKIKHLLKDMGKDPVYRCAIIDGEKILITYSELLYLRYQCKVSPDFEEFNKRVKVYDGPNSSYPRIVFNKDGKIETLSPKRSYTSFFICNIDDEKPDSNKFNLY